MNPFTNDRVKASRILEVTCEVAKQPLDTVIGYDRNPTNTITRFVAIWLIRVNTNLTLMEIGNLFSGRDHTTIVNAVKRAQELREASAEVRIACEEIMRRVD